jgi:hypothetical protein
VTRRLAELSPIKAVTRDGGFQPATAAGTCGSSRIVVNINGGRKRLVTGVVSTLAAGLALGAFTLSGTANGAPRQPGTPDRP